VIKVGVDLDGVLGDQVTGVLPKIKRDLGIDLAYDDVTEFRLPLGSSDIAIEIEAAQRDESYLTDMPLHPGAAELVEQLGDRYETVLITARPVESRAATQRWLEKNGLVFSGVINAIESRKSIYGVDVLVDDYLGNILDFVERTKGRAILVDRPWNRGDRFLLEPWLTRGRVVVAFALEDVLRLVGEYASDSRQSAVNFTSGRH
jgi:5'(3')-deoxyribonucleotidase